MKSRWAALGSIVAFLLVGSLGHGHLCNNIYRTPDRLIVKPEKQSTTVDGVEQVRVFIQNNYHTYVTNLRLVAETNDPNLAVTVIPGAVSRLKAGERTTVTVRMQSGSRTRTGRHSLRFRISADNIGFQTIEAPSRSALRAVLKDPNGSPNIMAAESLARMNDEAGSNYLKQLINNRSNRDYRARGVRALGKAGLKKNASALRTLLQDDDGFIKGNALLALGLLKDNPSVFQAYWQDRDDFIRSCAVSGLVLSGNRNYLSWLQSGLRSKDTYVRIACGWGLAANRVTVGIQALDRAFATEDPMQRTMAGDAMVDVANRK